MDSTSTPSTGPTTPGTDVLALIRAADPLPARSLVAVDLDRSFDDLSRQLSEIGDQEEPSAPATAAGSTRRRRRALTGLIAAALVLLGTASLAAAGVFTTHTATFGAPHKTENDTSELLRVDAPDFPRLALQLARGIPYPPGDRAQNYLPLLIEPNSEMQAKGIRGVFAGDAQCAWYGYWLQARGDGDPVKMDAALQEIAALPTWRAITAVDTGGPTYAAWARSAAAGDASPIQRFVAVNCTGLPTAWSGR